MKSESFHIPEEADQRLREWADYFRDRRRWLRCGSAEGRYKRFAGDPDPEGWGEPESAPRAPERPRDWVLRAIETNGVIVSLPRVQRWAVTYAYAYPNLPRFVVLRAMKKYAKRHLTWREYLDQADLARMKVWAHLARG